MRTEQTNKQNLFSKIQMSFNLPDPLAFPSFTLAGHLNCICFSLPVFAEPPRHSGPLAVCTFCTNSMEQTQRYSLPLSSVFLLCSFLCNDFQPLSICCSHPNRKHQDGTFSPLLDTVSKALKGHERKRISTSPSSAHTMTANRRQLV